ncbi:sulfotransferase family 2 domain-containing protein [Roseibium sp.]|uniref:sulfotransferase family 2 domain-containing protein n=1 Tax=Roseibium sp. TaxID=1936156 RepID=UPI001B00AE92|nr:sulfotransferase family 2 domain-containing protein [Roseibium sp.]MBO6858951.1 hypothetical protein [Roseibium sp.]
MLNRMYSILDRRLRPLRNHVFLAFPKHKIAFARIAEPAFQLLRPVLHCLAGTDKLKALAGFDLRTAATERLLFHGNVELLTARELKRRHPEMKVAAWVQDPMHRLAYCYEKVILSADPLPAYYEERQFNQDMTPQEFVSHVASISDLEADNLFRSQTAALTYKGMLTADLILQLEDFDQSFATFLSESSLRFRTKSPVAYHVDNFVGRDTLLSFTEDSLVQQLRRRYKSDYDLFYKPAALSA